MYKKAISGLLLFNLLILASYFCVAGAGVSKAAVESTYEVSAEVASVTDDKSSIMGMVTAASSEQRVVDFGVLERMPLYVLDEENYEILLRIVESEAGGEDEDGKLLVANVVLNRVNNDKFPDTVQDVVFQRSGGVTQFSPVSSGKIWKVEISEETIQAVERAIYGEDISQGALYFASRQYANSTKMKWFDNNLTFLFKHGRHEFFS